MPFLSVRETKVASFLFCRKSSLSLPRRARFVTYLWDSEKTKRQQANRASTGEANAMATKRGCGTFLLWGALFLAGAEQAVTLAGSPAGGPDPLSHYQARRINGFRVIVNKRLLQHPPELAAALKEIENQTGRMEEVLPADRWQRLQQVRIWLEWDRKADGAAEYHSSESYLRDNGYLTVKAHSVEICNARNFVLWSQQDQPWMLFHELAHAYHYQVLGVDEPTVKGVYQLAVQRKKYESVERGGTRERHYGLTNEREYFAELSEAYWGVNDYFPYRREELKKFDPLGYALMRKVWEE